MKISLNWLKEFVEVPDEPRQLKANLTGIGLNVEAIESRGDDIALDVEVTTNRPDCLSHYGVARELAALYRKPLGRIPATLVESKAGAADEVSIAILDPELCARYCGCVIRNVQVKASPEWLARRLEDVGQRSINNVADITNYVLMELGHPLHAFDLARIRDRKIIVRRARPREPLRTLDGVDRKLTSEDLVIADSVRPVALAGIMGGEDSEISPGTKSVLLESAWFDPVSIRRTAKSQGLRTEASHRFERGADIEMSPLALDRASALIAELAGGEVLSGRLDVYPAPKRRQAVVLRRSEILRLLGVTIGDEEIERILSSLGFVTEREDVEGWRVKPPAFRLDVTREVDLIEEVARHFGYDRLPMRVRSAPPRLERDLAREKTLATTSLLVGLGYREIIPPSMVDPEENARFTDRPTVLLANPLSQEASAMRSTTLLSMVRAIRWNLDRNQNDLRFFELGKTYTAGGADLPDERRTLTLALTGHRRPPSVHDTEREFDFFDLKGDLERLFAAFDFPGLRFEPETCRAFEPGLCGRFTAAGETLATFGRLSDRIARDYKLRQTVWLAEVDFESLCAIPLEQPAFRVYSKFPAVERDFSLIAPGNVSYDRILGAIQALHREEIRRFEPVERRRSEELPSGAVPAGHVSLLLRFTFQSANHTLASEEIEEAGRRVLEALKLLDIHLRT